MIKQPYFNKAHLKNVAMNTKENQEKATELFLEEFVPHLQAYLHPAPIKKSALSILEKPTLFTSYMDYEKVMTVYEPVRKEVLLEIKKYLNRLDASHDYLMDGVLSKETEREEDKDVYRSMLLSLFSLQVSATLGLATLKECELVYQLALQCLVNNTIQLKVDNADLMDEFVYSRFEYDIQDGLYANALTKIKTSWVRDNFDTPYVQNLLPFSITDIASYREYKEYYPISARKEILISLRENHKNKYKDNLKLNHSSSQIFQAEWSHLQSVYAEIQKELSVIA